MSSPPTAPIQSPALQPESPYIEDQYEVAEAVNHIDTQMLQIPMEEMQPIPLTPVGGTSSSSSHNRRSEEQEQQQQQQKPVEEMQPVPLSPMDPQRPQPETQEMGLRGGDQQRRHLVVGGVAVGTRVFQTG
ncbi:hypothetical protein F4778DRAFT_787466 [Xylariomycetidae sp. FL2044]|nr:hypothetical protein F4778DRAFT_787466 [Xylariomycetidae sp. FL2044]